MLREFLEKICNELDVPMPKLNEQKIFPFRLSKEVEIFIKDLDPGVQMQTEICPVPKKRKEELFIYLMRANLLFQGTGGARIGVDTAEKSLTLSLGMPYETTYKAFKESFEDFVNYLVYWRDEVAKFEKEENVL